jgi:hypothetical protein
MNAPEESDHPPRWPGDAGARRLFEAVRDTCVEGKDLPARLEAGLRTALGLFASDPDLARLLTVDAFRERDDGAFDLSRRWVERFGELLREAAASDPRTSSVEASFRATFLIGGVRHEIGRHVRDGGASELPGLLPDMLESLLAFYFEPGEPRRLAQAALAGR